MDISTVTGSKVPADNVTSFYTFALGIVAGSFLAVGLGAIDAANGFSGDLLRTYLAVITAMLGGGIGLFVSRIGDRIADRRKIRRKIYNALIRIRELEYGCRALGNAIDEMMKKGIIGGRNPKPGGLKYIEVAKVVVGIRGIRRTASARPDFDEMIDTADDLAIIEKVDRAFSGAIGRFEILDFDTNDEQRRITHALLTVSQDSLDLIRFDQQALKAADEHFSEKLR